MLFIACCDDDCLMFSDGFIIALLMMLFGVCLLMFGSGGCISIAAV